MKIKSKLLLSMSMLLVVSLMLGAGTYAFFSASVSKDNNKFQSGKIKLLGFRDDIPLEGPMFYTEDDLSKGIIGTGYWKPGDSNTRGFFIQNTGLDVRLKKVSVETDGIISNDALGEFSDHGYVTISVIRRGDRDHVQHDNLGNIEDGVLQTEYAKIMKDLDNKIKNRLVNLLNAAGYNDPANTQDENKALYLEALAATKQWILNTNFNADPVTGELPYFVQEVHQASLGDFLANGEVLDYDDEFVVNKNEARYFGYTVSLDNPSEPDNELQGKEIKLKFTQEWIQKNR